MIRSRVALLALACTLLTAAAAPFAVPKVPSGTVLIANMTARTVWLVDAETGERRAVVQTREDPHEVAVSRDGRLAAITNYGSGDGNIIQFVDVPSGNVTHEVTVEGYQRLHGAAFLPDDALLALTSERTGEVLVINVQTGAIERTLPTGGAASHMLVLAGGWIYTANISDGTVSRIDPAGLEETATWPAGTQTEGVAATPDGTEVWTGSMATGDVVGVDGATGRELARVEGLSMPYRLAVTSNGETVVVSDPSSGVLGLIDRASGELTTIDLGEAAKEAGLRGDPSPQGFTLDPSGQWAFVSTKSLNRVAVVDLEQRTVVAFLESGVGPDGIAFTPVRTRVLPSP